MKHFAILLTFLVLPALTGCGSHPRSAGDVARAWSAALDRGDDEGAARLFAPGAQIVQNGSIVLETHGDALRWNEALPCGGSITSVTLRGAGEVLVVFKLTQRPRHRCDAPGSKAAALFTVHNGKIVLWHQTTVPEQNPSADQVI